MEEKKHTPTPFNNPDLQHLIHETNRLTGTSIRYIDVLKNGDIIKNDSRVFVAIEYIKSIRTAVDNYYKSVKDNYNSFNDLKAENTRLREALKQIVNPIKHFQETAEREGAQLNGQVAITLSNSAAYLKEIAEKALTPPRSHEQTHHSS